jgi:hypothetical protein
MDDVLYQEGESYSRFADIPRRNEPNKYHDIWVWFSQAILRPKSWFFEAANL